MVVALTTGQQLGLAGVAAVFIAFALAASFLLPRRDPNFPGARLPLFVAATVVLFAAMLAAVFLLATESEEEEGGHDAAATEPAAHGDPQAGESVFASAACGSCHVLEAAGSDGTAGPNLDELAPGHDAVVRQVTEGGGGMPAFGGQLSEDEIQDVAAFVVESTG